MKKNIKAMMFYIMLALVLAAFVSCDYLVDSDEYRVTVLINCTGGSDTATGFSYNFVYDDTTLGGIGNGSIMIPFEDIKTLTLTVTKDMTSAALQIYILKNDKVSRVGLLAANYPSSSSPTNTMTLQWKLDDEDDQTGGVPVTTGSDDTSTDDSTTTSGTE